MPRLVAMVLALAVALLAGCATPTQYQPKSFTGGYQERAVGVGENRWYVEFFGNGHTTRDTVMAYWLHRCAELTISKGYDYFVLIAKRPQATAPDGEFVRTRGGGGYVPIYVPGGTITTWSARGVIELRKGEPTSEGRPYFVAKEVLDTLRPIVQQAMQSGRNVTLPKGLFEAREERETAAAPARSEGVKLDDLDALLPKE